MTSTGECIGHLVAQLGELAGDGDFPEVAQIDFVPAEDGRTIAANVYLVDEELNGGLPLVSAFELDPVVRDEFEIALASACEFRRAMRLAVRRQ